MNKTISTLLTLLLLSACSSTPILQTEGVNRELSTKEVAEGSSSLAGTRVVWGGVVINSTNLEGSTRLELLAYPLDSQLRPQTDNAAQSRFLAYHQGYLETADYAAGRQVSMVGTLGKNEQGRVGEHSYTFPTLQVEQIHLWPLKPQESDTRVHFGIGVMFRN